MSKLINSLIFLLLMFGSLSLTNAQSLSFPCPKPSPFDDHPGGNWFPATALSPDGNQLAVAGNSGIYLFDPNTLALQDTLTCFQHPFEGYTLAWSPDSEYLAHVQFHYDSSSEKYIYNLQIWDVADQVVISHLDMTQFPNWACCTTQTLSWSPNGNYLALANPLYVVSVADVTKPHLVFSPPNMGMSDDWDIAPNSLAWSADEHYLAMADNTKILVWNTSTWEVVKQISIVPASVGQGVICLAWTSEGYLAAGGFHEPLHLWNTATWEEISLPEVYNATAVRFLSGKPLLAFTGDSGEFSREARNRVITILDVSKKQIIQRLLVPDNPAFEDAQGTYVQNLVWLPDGQHLLSLQTEGETYSAISLWDVNSGKEVAEMTLSPSAN